MGGDAWRDDAPTMAERIAAVRASLEAVAAVGTAIAA